MDESNNIKQIKNGEVSAIYKIFQKIYLKAPPVLKDLSDKSVANDYTEFVQEQIDFKKIDKKFKNGEYSSITDAMKDIRTVFLNCYSFYGTKSIQTKTSLKIEELLEKKISYLDKNYKSLANVKLTFNLLNIEGKFNSKFRYPKNCYDSVLLRTVAHFRPERLKKYKKLSTTLTTNKNSAHIFKKNILSWENEVHFNDIFHRYISSMWELPEIGNFVAILFKKLNLDIINQGEIERMFLIPKESKTMGQIMTTLLMPVKKKKFVGQVMPYKVWSEKLSRTVSDWCKVYQAKNKNKVIVMNSLGIHPDFWAIVNEKNPLVEKDYSELSYFVKVWLVKGLCDYVTIKFKSINDIITNCNERQCTIWKNDIETEEYFFFDSMPDLRIYYYNNPCDEPSLEFLKPVKTDKEEVKAEDNLPMNGFSRSYCTIQKEKCFKLIADSVESLRAFLKKLKMKRTSVPEKLICALENFITKIKSKEHNLTVLNNDSKIKIFKDYRSYPDRIQKDKDNILLWQEKDSKSTSQARSKEIILQKRTRQLVRKNYKTDEYYDSKEYINENEIQSISDFTDSKDEWDVINLLKNKVEESLQTPKLTELEKLLKVEDNVPKCSKIKVVDTNKKDKSIKSVELLKTQNKRKFNNNTNTIVNHNHNKRLINSKNMDTFQSNEKFVVVASDKEENKKPPVSLIEIITLDEDMQNDCEIINDDLETSISTCTENKNSKTNEQDKYEQIKSAVISTTVTHKNSSSKIKNHCNFKTNLHKSDNSQNSRITPTNNFKSQAISSITQKLSHEVSIIPINVHIPKDIEVTIIKTPQKKINTHFNSAKGMSALSNSHLPNNSSIMDVKCKVIPKSDLNGEVEFYFKLPNGIEYPAPNDLINQYLKEHNNQLPDYWLLPLPVEIANKYGIY
ncbi:hypothetical protein AGLY_009112 [Aphis glycines]|uniref:Bromo domain-containing protein n=1 Tax=Aphis glycines TaxID=307491 RepID=A0A6G0TKJ8_APHGL|nr:hypothetical protein AGLY_009112 [Aphis glycines]